MMPLHVVVGATGVDAAARREVAALAQQASQSDQAALRRELQQAAREVAQEARAAAQEARDAAREAARDAAREGTRAHLAAQGPMPIVVGPGVDMPGTPRITKGIDGRMTIVGPDGSTTILEPDGRYTVINARGQVTQSARPLEPSLGGMDPGAALSLSALSAFVFFFLGRWWSARKYRKRAVDGDGLAAPGELGGRMERIEQAVEAVAIEVERISEGQRFTTKLLSEMRSPAPLAVGEPRR